MVEKSPSLTVPDASCENILCELQRVQDETGCVPEEQIGRIADKLKVPVSEVYGVATFYSFISTRPLGKHVIRICQSLPCHLQEAALIILAIGEELGIGPGETSADGKFSFVLTNCIGACDQAPAMLIDNDVHGNLTREKVANILKSYK